MSTELVALFVGAVINLAIALLIVRFIYYPRTQSKHYVFTFLAFNTVTFFVMGLLTSASVGVGVGFGLFAIFSLLRYRTDEIPIREMTYLFVIIAMPVMNSILIANGDMATLTLANSLIVAVLFVLERGWGFRYEGSRKVTYDRMDLVAAANKEVLIADLRNRTGLPIKRIDIGRIDFSRDITEIVVFFDEQEAAAQASPVHQGARRFPTHSQEPVDVQIASAAGLRKTPGC